jgi:ribosome biogenesis GTPase
MPTLMKVDLVDLAAWGWTAEREALFRDHRAAGRRPGRVTWTAGSVTAITAAGPVDVVVQRRSRRSMAGAQQAPAVGDWLALEPVSDGVSPRDALREILPRTSAFARSETARAGGTATTQVIAANVDVVLLVSAFGRDLSPRRIERYLTLAWASGARPIVVLNKLDLCSDLCSALDEVAPVAPGVPLLPVAAISGDGMDAVRAVVAPGRTLCLLGSSGVGKSTIANALLGRLRQAVSEVRADDERGRHTTTARELIPLPDGGLLVDTPGLRSVGLVDDGSGMEQAFVDVEALASACRFRDCRHDREPGCAVRAAIDDGELARERLDGHRKLVRELRSIELRADVAAARAESRRLGRLYRGAGEAAKRRHDQGAAG